MLTDGCPVIADATVGPDANFGASGPPAAPSTVNQSGLNSGEHYRQRVEVRGPTKQEMGKVAYCAAGAVAYHQAFSFLSTRYAHTWRTPFRNWRYERQGRPRVCPTKGIHDQ